MTGTRIAAVAVTMNASAEAQPATVRKVAFGHDYINSYVRKQLAVLYGV